MVQNCRRSDEISFFFIIKTTTKNEMYGNLKRNVVKRELYVRVYVQTTCKAFLLLGRNCFFHDFSVRKSKKVFVSSFFLRRPNFLPVYQRGRKKKSLAHYCLSYACGMCLSVCLTVCRMRCALKWGHLRLIEVGG